MDENNQYNQAMTKLLPYGCIKKQTKKNTQQNLTYLRKRKKSSLLKDQHFN